MPITSVDAVLEADRRDGNDPDPGLVPDRGRGGGFAGGVAFPASQSGAVAASASGSGMAVRSSRAGSSRSSAMSSSPSRNAAARPVPTCRATPRGLSPVSAAWSAGLQSRITKVSTGCSIAIGLQVPLKRVPDRRSGKGRGGLGVVAERQERAVAGDRGELEAAHEPATADDPGAAAVVEDDEGDEAVRAPRDDPRVAGGQGVDASVELAVGDGRADEPVEVDADAAARRRGGAGAAGGRRCSGR